MIPPRCSSEPLFRFLTEDRQSHFGRVAGLAVASDGALLVSEDTNGVIYRISHDGGPQQAEASD